MTKPKRAGLTAAIDDHVGRRIRERRVLLGLTQEQLAKLIGVTYQQAHKYERGINRVSAGRLFEIARVLSVPVGFFFDGITNGIHEANPNERMTLGIAQRVALLPRSYQQAISEVTSALEGLLPASPSGAAAA